MENTSVSKGVFVNKGRYKLGQRKKAIPECSSYSTFPWYNAYKEAWSVIEQAANRVNTNTFKQVLSDLYDFVSQAKTTQMTDRISTAALITGVNLQDHDILFGNLESKIKDITKYITVLSFRNCTNLKTIMEVAVRQFVSKEDEETKCHTFHDLNMWHKNHPKDLSNIPFVVIIPEFESINSNVLSDFILSLSCYTSNIKFVIILGVATTIRAVHDAFMYNVISKLQIKVYHMPKNINQLNDIIEGTMLSSEASFKLIGQVIKLLAENFLFNELSVNGYLQGYKICMLYWFFNKNMRILCLKSDDYRKQIDLLNAEDILSIRNIPSIIFEIEKEEVKRQKQLDNEDFKNLLAKIVNDFHCYLDSFIVVLKCLHILIHNLPQNKLGTKLREIYETAVSSNLTESKDYKETMKLLKHLSKEELVQKVEAMTSILEEHGSFISKTLLKDVKQRVNEIKSVSLEIKEPKLEEPKNVRNRTQWQNNLKIIAESCKSEYEIVREKLIDFLDVEIFRAYLKNPKKMPAHELFNCNISNVKSSIVGSMKGAINKAATDPSVYLGCSCCKIDKEETILDTMLDVCIIYKLQTEHPKLINMYDWLQSFLSIINPTGDEQREVHPKLRARFTQAVADLEHLGFVKVSKKKVDHVKRLMLI